MSINPVEMSGTRENNSRSKLLPVGKIEYCEPEDESQNSDDTDYFDELIRGAQAIIAEYHADTSTRSTNRSAYANVSLLPEELSRQVEEILTENPVAVEVGCPQQQQCTENIQEQPIEDDDDVVFISSEQIQPTRLESDVIDLCSPFGAANRRRRRSSEIIELDTTLEGSTPKRNYIPPPPPSNLNITREEPAPVEGVKLTCAVCMDNPSRREPMATVCGHIFCKKCIFRAIKCSKKCPLCNTKLSRMMVHRIYL